MGGALKLLPGAAISRADAKPSAKDPVDKKSENRDLANDSRSSSVMSFLLLQQAHAPRSCSDNQRGYKTKRGGGQRNIITDCLTRLLTWVDCFC